jgi:hypothetical protein
MKPSFSRYTRVHLVLQTDPLLQHKLSKVLVPVKNTNGSVVREFPVEVIKVTNMLHDFGMDTGTMSKASIIVAAFDILVKHVKPTLPKNGKPPTPPTPPPPPPPKKPMEKPITDVIQERMTATKAKIELLTAQMTQLKTELTNCETALNALLPKADPEPPPQTVRTRMTASQRSKDGQEFTEEVMRLLSANPMTVQEIAKLRGIKPKHCYSRLFRLKEKGLLEIANNVVTLSPGTTE